MNISTDLFPHVDRQPNLAALGDYALAYLHPDDLHMTLIFNGVSSEFVTAYVESREWCRDAATAGWRFRLLPAVEIGGTIQ
jgi:hypothetical protein